MRCPYCSSEETTVWAHNGGVSTHHWGESDERDCCCTPKLVCVACDAPLMKQHGFVVLDAECFGFTNDTLQ